MICFDIIFLLSPLLFKKQFSGYGKSKNDLKFKFLDFGVDFGRSVNDLGVNFKPLMYRPLDIFPNTYIGPGIGYDMNDNKSLFLSLEVNF